MSQLPQASRRFKPIWTTVPVAEQAWRSAVSGRPLVIEIGAGVGLHPIAYAKKHPSQFIIAIEKTKEKFTKLKQRVENHPQLTNILPVHANAIEWITRHIQAGEVSQVFILYPNPYPKAAQQNKRFTRMPFMQYLFKTLKPHGLLTLATNEAFYYEEALSAWQKQCEITITYHGPVGPHVIAQPRTHFERKYLQRGEPCFEIQVQRMASGL